jgi:pilus assembly protein CpaB
VSRRAVSLVAATLVAVVGVALVAVYVQGAESRARQRYGQSARVLVTRDAAPAGTPAHDLILQWRTLPRAAVPAGAVTELDRLAGHVTTAPLFPGVPIVTGMFGRSAPPRGAEGAVSGASATGMVVPVRVNDLPTIGGLLKPGDHVTLFASNEGRTRVVVARVPLVGFGGTAAGGTGQRADGGAAPGAEALLVDANPQDAAAIIAAARIAPLDVALPGSRADVPGDLSARG